MSFILAIDGPAGSGKGTITKKLAEKLDLINIDTGAMYRCVALFAIENNVESNDIEKIQELLNKISIDMKIEGKKQKIILNGKDVTDEIRTTRVDDCVAKYAAVKCVREKMVSLQREMGQNKNIIMEGRDIGTVVFPEADIKIYLDATLEERANRRYKQDIEKGMDVTYEEILEGIKQRHKLETERAISPLKKAEDAIYVDSTNLTINEVVDKIIEIVNSKGGQDEKVF